MSAAAVHPVVAAIEALAKDIRERLNTDREDKRRAAARSARLRAE